MTWFDLRLRSFRPPSGTERPRLRYVLGRRAEAARADLDADGHAFNDESLVLDVGLERAVSARGLALPTPGVLVPDIAAVGSRLTADVTLRHGNSLYA